MRLTTGVYGILATHKHGVPDEEERGVVSGQVPEPIVGVELHSKATRVPHCVSTATLPTWMHRGNHIVK